MSFTIGDVFFTAGALSAAGFIGGAIPQGLGVAEAATVGMFQLLHFPGPAAVAFALARRGRILAGRGARRLGAPRVRAVPHANAAATSKLPQPDGAYRPLALARPRGLMGYRARVGDVDAIVW